MNLLLDTHIAIWALNDDASLSEKARNLILDPDNTIYYSTVSVWEVLLKHSRRPEHIPFDEKAFAETYGPQLKWYAEAIRELTGKPVKETWLYSLSRRKAYRTSVEQERE